MDIGPILAQYGLAGLVIAALASVVVYLNKQNQKTIDELKVIQEQRLTDARETRDRLAGPMQEQARLSEKIYDLLISGNSRRRP